jgi:hypothetical protein
MLRRSRLVRLGRDLFGSSDGWGDGGVDGGGWEVGGRGYHWGVWFSNWHFRFGSE